MIPIDPTDSAQLLQSRLSEVVRQLEDVFHSGLAEASATDSGGNMRTLGAQLDSIRRLGSKIQKQLALKTNVKLPFDLERKEQEIAAPSNFKQSNFKTGTTNRTAKGWGNNRLQSKGRQKNPERRAARNAFNESLASIAAEKREGDEAKIHRALEVLGGSPGCPPAELRALYRYMLRKTHPDTLGGQPPSNGPSFDEVQEAWGVLAQEGLTDGLP
jgi:hypothetical protein